eukprot:563671-Hanusia_phi.AAC.3
MSDDIKHGSKNLFDISLVGKDRSKFKLPIATHTIRNGNKQPPRNITLSSYHHQGKEDRSTHSIHVIDAINLSQPSVYADLAHPSRPPSRPLSESSVGSFTKSAAKSENSMNNKSSFCTVDLNSNADTVDVRSDIRSVSTSIQTSFFSEFVRVAYILGFCNILLLTGALTSLGARLAINLAILSSAPTLSMGMIVHCFIRERKVFILLPFTAMIFLAYGCSYNMVGESPIPILAHIPGILLMCIFFSAICSGARRIINLIITMLVCLCIAGNAVFSLTEDRNMMIISSAFIFALLFIQSNIGNVFCGTSCAAMCNEIIKNKV